MRAKKLDERLQKKIVESVTEILTCFVSLPIHLTWEPNVLWCCVDQKKQTPHFLMCFGPKSAWDRRN